MYVTFNYQKSVLVWDALHSITLHRIFHCGFYMLSLHKSIPINLIFQSSKILFCLLISDLNPQDLFTQEKAMCGLSNVNLCINHAYFVPFPCPWFIFALKTSLKVLRSLTCCSPSTYIFNFPFRSILVVYIAETFSVHWLSHISDTVFWVSLATNLPITSSKTILHFLSIAADSKFYLNYHYLQKRSGRAQ